MKNWFTVFILFFVLGLLVYSNSFNNKFLMDDYAFLDNPILSSAKFLSSQWNPFRDQTLGILDSHGTLSYYRPMAHMVLDLDYVIFKNNFWQYHLFNLFLFTFAASLIHLLIVKVSRNYNLAFLTGLFYLIHPINGIVVNYISACVFALQVIFTLGTILLLWESLERNNDRICYFLSLSFSFLSLFWNESGIMVPFYVSAFILLFRNDPLRKKISYLFPYFLIVLSYVIFRLFFVNTNGSILKQLVFSHITPGEYSASLFRVVGWYISRLFYPQGIVMQWATPVLRDHLFWNDLGAVLLPLFFLLLFVRFSKERVCQLAIAWILIGFAPVILAAFRAPNAGAMIEPHWFIFSSIGFFIMASYFCLMILNRTRTGGVALIFTMVLVWSTVSHAYNRLWADQITYARFWSQEVPDLKSTYYYLAYAYQKEGDVKEARRYYILALNGNPLNSDIYDNLGTMDAKEGHWKEAEANFEALLSISPFSAAAYNNLGNLYQQHGQLKKAEKYFYRALLYNPLLLEPRRSLAGIYLASSEYQKAADLCLKNLEIVDDDPDTLFLLVNIYMKEKDPVSVKKYAHLLINLESDPEVLTRLGVSLSQGGLYDTAWDSYTKALRVAPDYKDAYFNAGSLLGNLGQYDQAVHVWQAGLKADPSDQRFKDAIARALILRSK